MVLTMASGRCSGAGRGHSLPNKEPFHPVPFLRTEIQMVFRADSGVCRTHKLRIKSASEQKDLLKKAVRTLVIK